MDRAEFIESFGVGDAVAVVPLVELLCSYDSRVARRALTAKLKNPLLNGVVDKFF